MPQPLNAEDKPNKKISTIQITAIAGGIFVLVMVIYMTVNWSRGKNMTTNPLPSPPETQLTPSEVVAVDDYLHEDKTGQTMDFQSIVFTGMQPTFPESLLLYQNNSPQLTQNQILNQLEQAFNVQQQEVEGFIFWTGPEYAMDFNELDNSFQISRNELVAPSIIEDQERARLTAKAFIEQLWPQANSITLVENKTEMLTAYLQPQPTTADQAMFMTFHFTQQLSGLPVYPAKNNSLPYQITVDGNYQVVKAILSPEFFRIQSGNSATLISLEQAVLNINAGQALMLQTVQEDFIDFDLTLAQNGSLTSVELQYRQLADGRTIIPFYKFDGAFYDRYGTPFTGVVITPAIVVQ